MSLYSELLSRLKRELAQEVATRKKKKKKFTDNQKIMIAFINGVTNHATFNIKDMEVVLRKGHSGGGFHHILENHYCDRCRGRITLNDILNFDLYLQRAIKLSNEGVTSDDNDVYQYIKGLSQYKIILSKEDENKFVVSFYNVD